MRSPTNAKYTRKSLLIFCLSAFVFMFIVLANTTNLYAHKITGAIFEILWLPVLALAIALPVYILVLFVKNKFHFQPLHMFSLFVVVAALVFMYLYNSKVS